MENAKLIFDPATEIIDLKNIQMILCLIIWWC